MKRSHSMPFGAELRTDGVAFRLWAPKALRVDVYLEVEKQCLPLAKLEDGWFELIVPQASAGTRYKFQINDHDRVPDPASRFQPEDVHGPSEVIDPHAFDWNDDAWRGRPWEEAAIYELHVGTFTPEGSFRAAEQKLDYLRELGITAIELMPLADFPGRRNWGYDGVLQYAPDSSYGHPEDLKHLVQAAHSKGMMIFLDVVYNHFGPEGNYLHVFSPQFFTSRHHTPWGDAINFDGPQSRVVRDFFVHNALYWLEEYHFDGLRLDAVHAIVDDSSPDILTELAQAVRERLGANRIIHLMLENEANESHYLQRDERGQVKLYDAQWDDDIHHAAHVLITGESDGYYSDYVKHPARQLCRCLAEGFAFQGEFSDYHKAVRGERSAALPLTAFISFLQNHDQIGNRAFGDRIAQIGSAEKVKALMEVLLLAPSPPLLFMGEEFGAASPFLFFCDYQGELATAVTNGRRNEFARFAKFSSSDVREQIPDPNEEQTFLRSKLDWDSVAREPHARWLEFYRELLSLRQSVLVPHLPASRVSRAEYSDPDRTVAIDWMMRDGALLELRANLGNKNRKLAPSSGSCMYGSEEAVTEFREGRLLAWSVLWFLRR